MSAEDAARDGLRASIVSMLRAGSPPAAVADALGITESSVRGIAWRSGLTLWDWRGEAHARMVAEYAGGSTTADIASRYGCAPNTVNAAVRRAGVTVRKASSYRANRPEPGSDSAKEALRLVRDGQSLAAAGRAVGLSRERVRQLVAKYGTGDANE